MERLKLFKLPGIAFVVLLSPWLLQLILCPPGQVPTGHILGWSDYWTFLVKMDWGRLGHWTYANQLTPEPAQPAPIYLFYLFMGHISKWTGLSVFWVFHLTRSLIGAIYLTMWWNFCRRFTHPFITFILGLCASFGFMSFTSLSHSDYFDTFVQGHAAMTGLFGFTHYLLDGIGFLLLIQAYPDQKNIIPRSLVAGILIGMVHPFLLPLLPLVFLTHAAYSRENVKSAINIGLWTALGGLPFVIPMFMAYQSIPWLQTWRLQTGPDSHFWESLILMSVSFGIAGVVAWLSIGKAIRGDKTAQVSAFWLLIAGLLMLIAPIPNSREYGFFLTLPISIISAPILVQATEKINTMKINWVLVCLILLSCISQAHNVVRASIPNESSYIPKEIVTGLEWLKAHGKPGDTVVCTPDIGLMIPVYTGMRPWVAHVSETIKPKAKRKEVEEFFKQGKPISAQWAVYVKIFDKEPKIKQKPVYENKEMKIWEIPERR